MARFAAGAGCLAACALLGCSSEPSLPEGTYAPVKVGVVTSLSGGLESLGPGWAQAALLAEQEANSAGGVLPGRLVQLVVADDGTDPAIGRAAAARLVDDGVVAVVGAAGSDVTLSVAEVTGPARVPQISCCSTSPMLTDLQGAGDRYLFRTVPSDELQAEVLVETAREDLGCTRLAILHLDNNYGRPFGEAIAQSFTGSGGTVVSTVAFQDERASYDEEVRAVAAATPGCIAIVGYPESAGAIVRDWHSLASPPDVTWIGTDGVRADGFVAAAGDPSLVDGFMGTAPKEQSGGRREDFVARYQTAFDAAPVIFGSSQYDAAALAVLAIARAGSTDGTRIRDALYEVSRPNSDDSDRVIQPGQLAEGIAAVRAGEDVNYDGAGGAVDLDEYGNVLGDYEIWRYDAASGTFQTIDTVTAGEIGR